MDMRVSAKGREFISKNEGGAVLTAYKCPAGVLTIGVGHTGPDVHEGQTITAEEADRLLAADLASVEAALNRLVPARPFTQEQFDALADFAFNCGTAAFGSSTLRRKAERGDPPEEVAAEFYKWVYAKDPQTGRKIKLKGLENRRIREAVLYRRGCYESYPGEFEE